MMVVLQDEQNDDIKKRDKCKLQYTSVASVIQEQDWKIENNVAMIDKLQALIEKRTEEKEETIKQIEEVTQEMKDMEEQRTEENTAFVKGKEEDISAIEIMTQAKKALAEYGKKNMVELLQQGPEFEKSADQAPDTEFSGKGKRKGESKGILSIMTMLIEDLE